MYHVLAGGVPARMHIKGTIEMLSVYYYQVFNTELVSLLKGCVVEKSRDLALRRVERMIGRSERNVVVVVVGSETVEEFVSQGALDKWCKDIAKRKVEEAEGSGRSCMYRVVSLFCR